MIRITEDSLKPEIKNILEAVAGAGCVTETTSDSGKFDLFFRIGNYLLILEVKVGGIGKLTEAIVQASNYAQDVKADGTIVLLFPGEVRREFPASVPESASEFVTRTVREGRLTCLVLSPFWNTRFVGTVRSLARELLTRATQPPISDPTLLVDALRESTMEISARLTPRARKPLVYEVAASLDLFAGLSGESAKPREAEPLISDLAAHIFVNQLLLYHLLAAARVYPQLRPLGRVTSLKDVEHFFRSIYDIDYRPIYRVEIVTKLPDSLLPVVNRIILALKALRPEAIPHDLLGRLFHEFLPFDTRKQLAAFYTRAVAGELLAAVSITSDTKLVFDPACGSGTLLVSAYRRKAVLDSSKDHPSLLEELYGTDIMPFAAHLAALNLTLQDYTSRTDEVLIGVGNSLDLTPGKSIPYQLPMFEKVFHKVGVDEANAGIFLLPRHVDLILMNPPYTDIKRHIRGVLGKFENAFRPAQNYWAYFLALADSLLRKRGRIAAVLPRLFLFGNDSRAARSWTLEKGYEFEYLVRSCKEVAFTEDAKFRDYLLVLQKATKKEKPRRSWCAVVYIKKSLAMSLEEASELGQVVRERAEGERLRARPRPIETADYSIAWVSNEAIRRDVLNGEDSLLWSSVCWERPANATILNGFYEAVSRTGALLPMQALFGGRRKWAIRGMEPKPESMYRSAFVVRPTPRERVARSFLVQWKEGKRSIRVQAFGTTGLSIPKKCLVPGLRSISYIDRYFVGGTADWVIVDRFPHYHSKLMNMLDPKLDFLYLHRQLKIRASHLALAKRIDFSARGTSAVAFYSEDPMLTSNQLYQVLAEPKLARRLALWLNSTFVMIHLLLHRSETRGSFSDILLGQLGEIPVPAAELITGQDDKWARFEAEFGSVPVPSLLDQFRNPNVFRHEFDRSMLSVLHLPRDAKSLILEQLSSVYRALADELQTISAVMRGAVEEEEASPSLTFAAPQTTESRD